MFDTARTRYLPIIRTRGAELKGFEELSTGAKDAIVPVVEYTKSRRTKKNVDGALSVCVASIEGSLNGRPYVADVTTMASLSNAETSRLLDQDNNFRNWRTFVTTSLGSNCIPVIHLTSPLSAQSVAVQCDALIRKSGYVAIRVPPDYSEVAALITALTSALGGLERVVLICDAGFVNRHNFPSLASGCAAALKAFGERFYCRAVASSGFPSSVVLPDYGKDDYGHFDLLEVRLCQSVASSPGLGDVLYSDYALIHPEDFAGTVTNWVPRVDVPLDASLFYYRFRRAAGGYIEAARKAVADPAYKQLNCWGDRNVQSAASGAPQGKSPAHWISVRVNFHISRQVLRLGGTI